MIWSSLPIEMIMKINMVVAQDENTVFLFISEKDDVFQEVISAAWNDFKWGKISDKENDKGCLQ